MACPYKPGTASCTLANSKFPVRHSDGPHLVRGFVLLKVATAIGHDEQIYGILVGAILGAVEQSVYYKQNCIMINHGVVICSTVGAVIMSLPGANNYHMDVTLTPDADRPYHQFFCWETKEFVKAYLARLQPEIQKVLGDMDRYTTMDCVTNLPNYQDDFHHNETVIC